MTFTDKRSIRCAGLVYACACTRAEIAAVKADRNVVQADMNVVQADMNVAQAFRPAGSPGRLSPPPEAPRHT